MVLYQVKTKIPAEHVTEFNEWYHNEHIPEVMKLSGCTSARRFKAIEAEDTFTFLAVYEFSDKEPFIRYQNSKEKQDLVKDFMDKFGDRAELKASSWEQIYP